MKRREPGGRALERVATFSTQIKRAVLWTALKEEAAN